MKRFVLVLTAAVACGLALPSQASAQMFTDFKPGGYVPKDGYTPDPMKVMYAIFWYHKKRTNEFDHRAYYMNADGVNDVTAEKIVKAMQERYPNLVVYKKETNERDIKGMIETQRKAVKFIQKDWLDVKQPEKVEMPNRSMVEGRIHYGYDETNVKNPAEAIDLAKLAGAWHRATDTKFVDPVFVIEADGTIFNRVGVTSGTRQAKLTLKDNTLHFKYQNFPEDEDAYKYEFNGKYADGKITGTLVERPYAIGVMYGLPAKTETKYELVKKPKQ